MATATYAVILENFGWAMGYNVSALPLAAAGLLDPARGRRGHGAVEPAGRRQQPAPDPRRAVTGRRRCAHRVSPAARSPGGRRRSCPSSCSPRAPWAPSSCPPPRARACLPTLPDIVEVSLATGGQAEVYLSPGSAGPNELHLILPSVPTVGTRRDGVP